MKYTVKLDNKIIANKVSLDEALELKLQNPLYEVKEITSNKAKEWDEAAAKEAYIKLLTPAQYNDLHLGNKEIVLKGTTFGLKRVKGSEEHSFYSPYQFIKDREVEVLNKLKKFLKDKQLIIGDEFMGRFTGVNGEEFDNAFSKILKA